MAKRVVAIVLCMILCLSSWSNVGIISTQALSAGTNTNQEIGLAVNLMCTSTQGSANNVALHWDTTLKHDLYVVYRSLQEKDGYTPIYQGVGESCCDYNLQMNTTYYYQLAIVNDGQYTYSPVQKITTCEPQTTDVYNNQTGSSLSYETSGTKVGDTYYSYSMKSNGNEVYFVEKTSSDGKTFSNERTIVDKNQNSDLGSCKLESVQQKYIASKNLYIIWAHWEQPSGYADGKALVITGTPGGNFTVHHIYNPLDVEVRDMTIFVDDDAAETGYLITAANEHGEGANKTMYIFQMNETYSDVTRIVKKVHENAYREFPNMVKKDGYYYLFTSQAAGWYPSKGGYIVTKDLGGTWSDLRDIGNSSTFSSQSGWIVNLGNGKNYIMHAYRWLKAEGTSGTTLCPLYFANGFAFYEYYPYFRYSTKTGELYPVQEGQLLSQGKPAQSSVAAKGDGYRVDSAFDGSYETSYTASGCKWPFEITVDLEKECELKNVQISWYICKGSEAYYQYKIEGSTDGSNYTTLLDRTSKDDQRVTKTYGFTSDLLNGRARYVRINVQNAVLQNNPNNNWYTPTVYEVKVFGDTTEKQYEKPNAPLVQYDFENGVENGSVKDNSGNSHQLTLQGNATCVEDATYGKVLYLDGNNGTYASLPNGILDYQNELTVSMDVKSEAEGNFFTFCLGNDDKKYLFYKIGKDKSGNPQFRSAITSNTWSGEAGIKTAADVKNWHRYTFVLDNSVAKVYIDGVLAMASAGITTKVSDLGGSLACTLGKSTYSSDGYFKGYIDNVTIYKQALQSEQVRALDEQEHTFGDWTVTKKATCTSDGEEQRSCSCGKTETRVTGVSGHTISENVWESDNDNHWHKCSTCGVEVDKASHSFGDWTVTKQATCTSEGEEQRSCSVCGKTETKVIAVTGHTVSENVWESDNDNHWHKCSICGVEVDKASHSFGDWTVTKQATCTSEGEEQRSCSVCGKTETRVIAVTEHTVSEDVWESDADNHWHKCSVCEEELDKEGHNFKWVVDYEASANIAGKRHQECRVCGYIGESEAIPPYHTHNYEETWEYGDETHWHECSICGDKIDESEHTCEDTWKNDEKSHWHECSICGAQLEKAKHTYGSWEVVQEATQESTGLKQRVCTVCGNTETSEIPVLEPEEDPTESTTEVPATTEDDGNATTQEPATTEDVDNATTQASATTQGVVSRPTTQEPATTEDVDNATTQASATTQGVVSRPTTQEPATTEDVDNATTQASATTQGVVSRPTTQEPATTEDVDNATTQASATTQGVVSRPTTQEPATTEDVDDATTQAQATTQGVVSRPTTQEPATTEVVSCDTGHSYGDWTVIQQATCMKTGKEQRVCDRCGKVESRAIPLADHTISEEEWENDADNHWHECSVCGAQVEKAKHTYGSWEVVMEATEQTIGLKQRTCTVCGRVEYAEIPIIVSSDVQEEENTTREPATTEEGADKATTEVPATTQQPVSDKATTQADKTTQTTEQNIPKANDLLEVITASGSAIYQVVNPDSNGNGTVIYSENKNKNVTKLQIPEEITVQGITYKVIGIADNACMNSRKLKSVTIGSNVISIGKNAFAKCSRLQKVVIGKNVMSIGKQAFYKDAKLKQITIKSKKISKIGKNAIKGIHKKATIKVPAKMQKYYKKLLKKSNGFTAGMMK